jgi:hypothetical protein
MTAESFKDQILYLIWKFSPQPPLFVKIIFLLFALFFFFVIIYFLRKTTWFERIFLQDFIEFSTFKPYGISKSVEAWKKIITRLDAGSEDEAKLAVIEADDLLNETLDRVGYKKEKSLGEKLDEITPDIITNLEEVNEAHRIRNNIIHDPDYRLGLEEAKKILLVYEKAIKSAETF